MRRRRKTSAEKANPFLGAMKAIDDRELQVVCAMTHPEFTLNDVIRWMFPENTLRILREAQGVVHDYYPKTVSFSVGENSFTINVTGMDIASPGAEAIDIQEHCNTEILSYVASVHEVHKQFNKVREVIKWFGGHNVTMGEAQYYWPTILCLLPQEHEIHKTNGKRYREVTGIGEIIPLLRETAGIVTSAILCPKLENLLLGKFTVSFPGEWSKTFKVL